VLSRADGNVVGFLLVEDEEATVALFRSAP
jgi:hypothetical protein